MTCTAIQTYNQKIAPIPGHLVRIRQGQRCRSLHTISLALQRRHHQRAMLISELSWWEELLANSTSGITAWIRAPLPGLPPNSSYAMHDLPLGKSRPSSKARAPASPILTNGAANRLVSRGGQTFEIGKSLHTGLSPPPPIPLKCLRPWQKQTHANLFCICCFCSVPATEKICFLFL